MKALVVNVSSLGDIMHALPVRAHIHAAMPDVSVVCLFVKRLAPLLYKHPLFRNVICVNTRG